MLSASTTTLALFGQFGPTEMIVIGIIGVLLFGRRLPEVGRNLGKSFVEFKKGLSGVDQEIKDTNKQMNRISEEAQNPTVDTQQTSETESSTPPNTHSA